MLLPQSKISPNVVTPIKKCISPNVVTPIKKCISPNVVTPIKKCISPNVVTPIINRVCVVNASLISLPFSGNLKHFRKLEIEHNTTAKQTSLLSTSDKNNINNKNVCHLNL